MKIHLLNDLHLEMGSTPSFHPSTLSADLHLLAGDVHLGISGMKWAHDEFKSPVAYVFGNHEYYDQHMTELHQEALSFSAQSHVKFLHQQVFYPYPDVRVLGCTLWTGFDLFDNPSQNLKSFHRAQSQMNDYRSIVVQGPRFLTAEDTRSFYKDSIAWLYQELSRPFQGKTIVVSHHAPSPLSLPLGVPSSLVDGAYANRLDEWIKRYSIDLWVHGHTHFSVDYSIGSTRIVSNPRGYYPFSLVNTFNPNLLIEI